MGLEAYTREHVSKELCHISSVCVMICESAVEISSGDGALGATTMLGEVIRDGGEGSLNVTPLSTSRKGLQNRMGENNCFLNSIVQVLWRLDPFRKSFLLLSGHACTEKSCIFCSLKVVFTQFQFSDRSTLPPDSLRQALAMAFAKRSRFQLGLMDDATECFEIILRWLHFHLVYNEPFDRCTAPHCLSHSKFGMTITEQAFCILCGTRTQPLTFTELVHYVPTSAIARPTRISLNGNRTCFGRLLRNAVDTEGRSCPVGCGEGLQMNQVLMNSPDVLTIGLIWDSDNATPNEIAQLVVSIESTLRPSDLFQSEISLEFRLVGVVCYYRKHYSTFLFDQQENVWNLYDDATVVEVGSLWSIVAAKICVGRFQPLLLFYENPKSEPVPMATAPLKTHFVDVPADFSSFSYGDSLTDLALSIKRHAADYEGGNPTVAQRKGLSSNLEDLNTLQESPSLPLERVPIMVTHHSSRDSSISNCSSKVRVQAAVVTNSDWHPQASTLNVTPGNDDNCRPWTTLTRSGQQDFPVSFQESRPDFHGFSDIGNRGRLGSSPCTTSSVSSLGRGVQTDPAMKTESVTVTRNTESDLSWGRRKFMPSFCNSSTPMLFGDGSDLSAGDWHPAEMLRNKRSSFACSSQNSFALDELSNYSCDDQLLSLGSRLSARRFPLSQGFFPRWTHGCTPFGLTRVSRNSQLIEDFDETQERYINPETVLTVLRSRGLRPHSGSSLYSKRQDDTTCRGSLKSPSTTCRGSSKSPSEQTREISVQLKVTHITSDDSFNSCNNSNNMSNMTQRSGSSSSPGRSCARFTNPPDGTDHPDAKTQKQKGILMKRRREKKKRVSFSDNVALVGCADDVPGKGPQDYVDYVRRIATQSHNLRSSSLSSTSSSDSSYSSSSNSTSGSTTSPLPDLPGSLIEGVLAVEVSGLPEEDDDLDSEDDTCIPEEDLDGETSDKIRCNLCCRKWIEAPHVYCRDCNIYLDKLQHRM